MTTSTRATPATSGTRPAHVGAEATRDRARRRPLFIAAAITLGSLGLLGDLLLVNHTTGKEILGPVTAASGVVVGLLTVAYLTFRARSRVARILLYALWATVAFFGLIGFSSHRQPVTAESVDQRQRPPLAPLVFTGLGIAGAVVLRSGTKTPKGS